MGEFAGYRCDGPSCNNSVNQKDPEARHWLMVGVKTADESYSEKFTFCSYNCFDEHVHEVTSTQHATME
jgi:hypothetical protein